MSESNPKTALAAIFPTLITICEGVSVYPLTLAHYALLEQINSYLVNGDHQPDAMESVKTMYICTHDAREIFEKFNNLDDEALEWAQQLPPGLTYPIMDAIKVQIDKMAKVVPYISDVKKKVAETAS